MVVVLLFCFQAGSVFAQLGALFNIGGHAALAIGNGDHQTKQEKLIDESSKKEKINGSNVTLLRVKESAIKSKAKKNIIALQNRLDQYAILYKNNQAIDFPKNDSDLIAIQDKDENWPAENYSAELRAYKRYAFLQKQQMPPAPVNNLNSSPADTIKNNTAGSKP